MESKEAHHIKVTEYVMCFFAPKTCNPLKTCGKPYV